MTAELAEFDRPGSKFVEKRRRRFSGNRRRGVGTQVSPGEWAVPRCGRIVLLNLGDSGSQFRFHFFRPAPFYPPARPVLALVAATRLGCADLSRYAAQIVSSSYTSAPTRSAAGLVFSRMRSTNCENSGSERTFEKPFQS